MASSSQQTPLHCCFENWMVLQETDLKQFLKGMDKDSGNNEKLSHLVEMCVKHYQEYHEKRVVHAQTDAPSFFSPYWCAPLENSFLWLGGRRPSLFIRLIYTLCGSAIEAHLDDFFQGVRRGNMGELSAQQIIRIDELQRNQALVVMANEWGRGNVSVSEVDRVTEAQGMTLAVIMEEADKLRLRTLKELVEILTPFQAVEFLVAAKRLHLALHEWCKMRSSQRGAA